MVFILGPTGSGKTSLAVKLAKKFDGEIISADSRQVYKGLDIGSGKDLSEYDGVKYHLIDICIPEEKFTLFDWLEQAKTKIEEIFSAGKLPIVVGGTGLYAKALAEGFRISDSSKLRTKSSGVASQHYSRDILNKMTLEKLQKLIKKLKIDSEKLDIQNPRRLIRAIEKTQEGISTTKQKPNFESLILAIDLPREELYSRIDKRVDVRFAKQRMLEEVVGLLSSGVSHQWLESLGLEYRIISDYLTQNFQVPISKFQSNHKSQVLNSKEFKEMAQELKWKTHGYARRQLTWLRKQQDLILIKSSSDAIKRITTWL